MKYLFIIIFSIFLNLAYANELPTEDEIYQQLVPYEKSRGLTIKKKEKASFDFDMINFEFDSSVISINSYEILKRIGNVLNRDDMQTVKFEIIGHTDAKGDANYNQKLSEKRAKSVKNYLIDNYEIKSSRLNDIGKGESQLLPNIDSLDSKNRRVQINTILN
jgi:outer membrane protein OmpA-like peptidoglycan-associated protein|tara:strand:- start:246 stop:731 length:486 start_codon:yes stop_codon:yes gene_type:complete